MLKLFNIFPVQRANRPHFFILHHMFSYLALIRLLNLFLLFPNYVVVLRIRFFLSLKKLFFCEHFTFQYFVIRLQCRLLNLHVSIVHLQALLDWLERRGYRQLVLKLDRHFLHLITDFHQIGMRSNVWLLFLFITVDPDLTCVLLSSDKLGLLIDLVKKLLALDFVLFLLRFLFNFKWVCLTFDLCQLLLLFFKLDFVGLE